MVTCCIMLTHAALLWSPCLSFILSSATCLSLWSCCVAIAKCQGCSHETCCFFCSCWHFMCCWKPARCFLLSNLNSFDMQHVVSCYRNKRHHIVLPYMIRIGWVLVSVNLFLFRFVDVSFLRWPWEYPWRQHMARCVDGFGVDTLWPFDGENGGLHEVTKQELAKQETWNWFLHKTLLVNSIGSFKEERSALEELWNGQPGKIRFSSCIERPKSENYTNF